eukprot:7799113-Pyramimonas_sp.AAC.1
MYVMPMREDASATTEEQASASIRIDGITFSSWAFGLEGCAQYLWRVGLKLKEGLAVLHLRLAVDKLAIADSSDPLLKRANEVLGMVAGAAVPSASHLGIDFAPGKHRRRPGANSTRRARWTKTHSRFCRLRGVK